MAFNPFHGFRKYKKTMFAVLTIMCMFVFVLSSGLGGRGDIFNRNWFGGSRTPAVAKIDGRRIDSVELRTLGNQRRLADEFMKISLASSQFSLISTLKSRLNDFPELVRSQIGEALEYKEEILRQPRLAPQYLQTVPTFLRTLQTAIMILEKDKKLSEADLLRRLQSVMIQDRARPDYFGELYFGGSVRSGQDLLDFLAWKWEADKYEIQVSVDAVRGMVRDEIGGSDSEEAAKTAMKSLRERYKGVTDAGLLEALVEEFRVRLVKAVLIGETSKSPNTIGAYVTPYEFYKHFRDVRTSIRVNMVPVTSDAFLAKVTEKPSEDQLKDLFKKHRADEPIPFLERPGFKDPKKAKVEWIGFKGEEPLIKKAAIEDSAKRTAVAQAVTKAIMAPPGDSFAALIGRLGAAAVVADPKLLEKRTDHEYERYVRRENETNKWVYSALYLFGVHDRCIYDPRVIAASVADSIGARGTGGSLLSPAVMLGAQSVVQELRERVRFGLMPLSVAGLNPAQLLGISDGMIPRPLPKIAVQAKLNDDVTAAVVSDFLRAETEKFEKTLTEKAKDIKKPEAKTELRAYIDEFIKKYGLGHGASAEFRDQYQMIDDPGLKPLKAQYVKDFAARDPRGMMFGAQFFDEQQQFQGRVFPIPHPAYEAKWIGTATPYSPFTKKDDQFYMAWKSDEIEPRLRDFKEARSDVEKAWTRAKARELAAKAADDLQKQLREKAVNNLASLKDFAASNKLELIEVGPIALRQESLAARASGMTQYQPPETPRDKVPFGAGDFCVKLMDLRSKPIGESMVLTDIPKDTNYVAVLTERTEPSELEFRMVYARSGFERGGGDPLLSEFEQEQRFKAREELTKQIRTDAKLIIVDEEELKRFSEKGSGEE